MLANRLTENPNWNVLLIEAGKVETPIQDVPIMAAYMQSTAYNWGYTSEPQAGSCLGMINLFFNCLPPINTFFQRHERSEVRFSSRQRIRRKQRHKLYDVQSRPQK